MTFAELLAIILITFTLVGFCAYVISVYTEMVSLMGRITRSHARIDMLRRRLLDELPKLIKICESDVGRDARSLGYLRVARRDLEGAEDGCARGEAQARLSDALSRLFEAVEAHPELHVHPSFERIYHRVCDLENQIEECRSLHDETAAIFNTRIEGFAERLVASWLSLSPVVPLGTGVTVGDEPEELAVSA